MKHLKNQKGSALVITIILMMIVSILGIAMLSAIASEIKINRAIEENAIARYLAQAGIDHSLELIENEPSLTYPYEERVILGDRSRMYNMKIVKVDKTYEITSKGFVEIGGIIKEQVTLEATVQENGKVVIME